MAMQGESYTSEFIFKDINDDNRVKEPTTITISVLDPNGSIIVNAVSPNHKDFGIYDYTFNFPSNAQIGTYIFRWASTYGEISTSEDKILYVGLSSHYADIAVVESRLTGLIDLTIPSDVAVLNSALDEADREINRQVIDVPSPFPPEIISAALKLTLKEIIDADSISKGLEKRNPIAVTYQEEADASLDDYLSTVPENKSSAIFKLFRIPSKRDDDLDLPGTYKGEKIW
jgi:hypothetical protein